MKDTVLKLCPFCGGKAEIKIATALIYGALSSEIHHQYKVHCTNCYAETIYYSKPEDAINAWNKRTQPEPPWTPCERKMPEEPGYYLTSNEYCSVSEDFYYDGHFSNADKNAYKVIAWMPKPESYKPIEDDFRGVTVYDVPPSEELTDEQVIDYCRKKG